MKMVKLVDLTQKILMKHIDSDTGFAEVFLLGYCTDDEAGEHISRYTFASIFVHGLVLDVAAGSCYGSSILRRTDAVKSVVSVDIDRDLLNYGKMGYDLDWFLCADAAHLPFKEMSFDSIVSIETLEHIRDQEAFLSNIKLCLKRGGELIISFPNKMYTSPFTPKPLNPYHANELYLGPLLTLLKSQGFKIASIYGGRKVSSLELIRRIFGHLLKSLLGKLSLKPYLMDAIYRSTLDAVIRKRWKATTLVDPDPSLFTYEELKAASNVVLYQYFVIHALKS